MPTSSARRAIPRSTARSRSWHSIARNCACWALIGRRGRGVNALGLRGVARHATNPKVTTASGDSAAQDAERFARDWEALRADGDIQFAPVKLPEPAAPPEWLEALQRFLAWLLRPIGDALSALGRALGLSGQVMTWLLIAIGVLLAAL